MARYHINGKGNVGTCRAKNGNCPFGGEAEHYDSAAEARAAFEKQMSGSCADPATPNSQSNEDLVAQYLLADGSDSTAEARDEIARRLSDGGLVERVAFQSWLLSMPTRDDKTTWRDHFTTEFEALDQQVSLNREHFVKDVDEMTSEEYEDFCRMQDGLEPLHREQQRELSKVLERDPRATGAALITSRRPLTITDMYVIAQAQKKPLRMTPTQTRNADALCASHGISRADVEQYASKRFNRRLILNGHAIDLHPSRNAWLVGQGWAGKHMGYSEELVAEAARSKRGEHLHGGKRSAVPRVAGQDAVSVVDSKGEGERVIRKGNGSAPNPEFIEALKKMYLGKFGKTPEQDGVDTGTLMAMFNKGQLG